MKRTLRDGSHAAVMLVGMMVCGLLGGPLLAAITGLPFSLAFVLGSGIPVLLGFILGLRAVKRSNRNLAARLSTEIELQRVLKGETPVSPERGPMRSRLSMRTIVSVALMAMTVYLQGRFGGVMTGVGLLGLWALLLQPRWQSMLTVLLGHGDTQMGLVHARSETTFGMRSSSQSSGRSSTGSDRQSRHDQRQVGSSTTRA